MKTIPNQSTGRMFPLLAVVCLSPLAQALQTWEVTTTYTPEFNGTNVEQQVSAAERSGVDPKIVKALDKGLTSLKEAEKQGLFANGTVSFSEIDGQLRLSLTHKWRHMERSVGADAQFTADGLLVWRNGNAVPKLEPYSFPSLEIWAAALAVVANSESAISTLQESAQQRQDGQASTSLSVFRDLSGAPNAFQYQMAVWKVSGTRDGDEWTIETRDASNKLTSTTTARPALQASNVTFPTIKPGDPVTIRGKQVHTVAWANNMPTAAELDARAEQRGHFALYGSILGGAVFIGLGTILLRRR